MVYIYVVLQTRRVSHTAPSPVIHCVSLLLHWHLSHTQTAHCDICFSCALEIFLLTSPWPFIHCESLVLHWRVSDTAPSPVIHCVSLLLHWRLSQLCLYRPTH